MGIVEPVIVIALYERRIQFNGMDGIQAIARDQQTRRDAIGENEVHRSNEMLIGQRVLHILVGHERIIEDGARENKQWEECADAAWTSTRSSTSACRWSCVD